MSINPKSGYQHFTQCRGLFARRYLLRFDQYRAKFALFGTMILSLVILGGCTKVGSPLPRASQNSAFAALPLAEQVHAIQVCEASQAQQPLLLDQLTSLERQAVCRCLLDRVGDVASKGEDLPHNGSLSELVSHAHREPLKSQKVYQRCTSRLKDTEDISLGHGSMHVCAAMPDKTVQCWGYNFDGQLGDGRAETRLVPYKVPGLDSVIQVDAGDAFSCALKQEGTIWCWGSNFQGQLGDGTRKDQRQPVKVVGITNAVAFSSTGSHSCALLADGTARCWGYNAYGQLGDDSTETRSSPVEVTSLKLAVQIATGARHTCALHVNGKVSCWGSNNFGQLGNSSVFESMHPIETENLEDVVAIGTKQVFTCALLYRGQVRCWGLSYESGKDADAIQWRLPRVLAESDVVALSVGSSHTCGLLSQGDGVCWGKNYRSAVGHGKVDESLDAPYKIDLQTAPKSISAGVFRSCAVLGSTKVYCWGGNTNGELGHGTKEDSPTPLEVLF